jgi:hypothetical protein
MPRAHLAATCLTTAGLLCGCGGLFPRYSAAPAEEQVVVSVKNHSWSDVTVYLVAGGLSQRLGRVSALGEATLDFASRWLNTSSSVRLRALPLAGQPFTSETILVFPGQAIFWTLENNLQTSSFSVY